jgi:hypothetical protein
MQEACRELFGTPEADRTPVYGFGGRRSIH